MTEKRRKSGRGEKERGGEKGGEEGKRED